MITVTELKRWLNTLPKGDSVAVDEGGLTLVSEKCPDAYLEVGGVPEEDEQAEVDLKPPEGYMAVHGKGCKRCAFALASTCPRAPDSFLLCVKLADGSRENEVCFVEA
jgi:hypothetical protein